MLSRRGTTLAETLIAITLASLVLATATASLLRQQQTSAGLAAHASVAAQLHPATTIVAAQLAHLSPAAGDFVPGEWRDTALQFRAPIATGVSCNATGGAATLLTDADSTMPVGGILSPPHAGDSVWYYSDTIASWTGRLLVDVATAAAGCGVVGKGATVRLLVGAGDTIPEGAPVRITRQMRLALYRAGDGTWQLGLREWSDAAKALAAPQPIAGPFLSSGAGVHTGFRYFDATGAELFRDRDATIVDRVRRVRLTLVAANRDGRAGRPSDLTQLDSVDIAFGGPHVQ
jgi:hypothetical protein